MGFATTKDFEDALSTTTTGKALCSECGKEVSFTPTKGVPAFCGQECMTKFLTKKRPMDDKVNHPNHYKSGAIEVIDYIKDQLTPDEFRGYIKGNLLKYISRERHKNGDEDLKKAQFYLNFLMGGDPR